MPSCLSKSERVRARIYSNVTDRKKTVRRQKNANRIAPKSFLLQFNCVKIDRFGSGYFGKHQAFLLVTKPPKTIKAVAQLLEEERLNREAALMSQEHRLIAALRNLMTVLFRRESDERRRLLPGVVSAFVWCLIPSAGTATVGVVAILSLILAWQQSRLLSIQNDKIEIQNVLAEAQRRAGLVFEITAIFEQIEKEKEDASKRTTCTETRTNLCYQSFQEPSEQTIFTPSRATLGRIAALTQALRPYRYLTVGELQKGLCPQDTSSRSLDLAYEALVGEIAGRGPSGVRAPIPLEKAKQLVRVAYASSSEVLSSEQRGLLRASFDGFGSWLLGLELSPSVTLNCAPASPERGQLLVSLHAAGIDISAIQAAGGDFTFSDIPGASLAGVRLDGVNLSGARLPGANFRKAHLHNVSFRNANIADARFTNAWISKSDFEGAQIQIYLRDGDAPLFLMPSRSDDNLFSGMRLHQMARTPNISERFCFSLELSSDLRSDVKALGLLIETRTPVVASKVQKQNARVIFDIGIPKTEVLSVDDNQTYRIIVEYRPLARCKS